MDINQLRTLACVAELGSLSKAGDRLCTAQPALSRQVRLLEEELGTRLFDRHGRGMVVTEQGRIVLRHALRILKELDDIKLNISDDENNFGGHVSIGMPPTVAEILAVPLIVAFREARPSATCRIVSAYSLYLFDWVNRGDVDIAILYDPLAIRSLKSEPLVDEELYVIAPAGSGLTLETPYPFRDLKDKPMLLPSLDHSLRQIVDRTAHDCGIALEVMVEVDTYATLKQLVTDGHGWTILPLSPVAADIAAGRLCGAALSPAPKRSLELSCSTDRPASRLTSAVREAIIKTSARLVADGAWRGKMLAR